MAPKKKTPTAVTPQRGKHGLTEMQKAFCEHLAAGNSQTEALRLAGSKAKPEVMAKTASNWVRLGKVQQYLKSLAPVKAKDDQSRSRIATAQERQEMWTAILRGEREATFVTKDGLRQGPPDWPARLKALEALGRAQGDFIKDAGAQAPQIKIVMPSGPMTQEQITAKREELWGGDDDANPSDP